MNKCPVLAVTNYLESFGRWPIPYWTTVSPNFPDNSCLFGLFCEFKLLHNRISLKQKGGMTQYNHQ